MDSVGEALGLVRIHHTLAPEELLQPFGPTMKRPDSMPERHTITHKLLNRWSPVKRAEIIHLLDPWSQPTRDARHECETVATVRHKDKAVTRGGVDVGLGCLDPQELTVTTLSESLGNEDGVGVIVIPLLNNTNVGRCSHLTKTVKCGHVDTVYKEDWILYVHFQVLTFTLSLAPVLRPSADLVEIGGGLGTIGASLDQTCRTAALVPVVTVDGPGTA